MTFSGMSVHRQVRTAAALGLVCVLSLDVAHAASTPHGTCAAAKPKAAAKKTASKLKCYTSAIKAGRAVDLGCLVKAESKLATAFEKAEAPGKCIASGDVDDVERDVDFGVQTLVADEPGGPGSTNDGAPNSPLLA
jgi:hypothetical protein